MVVYKDWQKGRVGAHSSSGGIEPYARMLTAKKVRATLHDSRLQLARGLAAAAFFSFQ